jgi:hypothetical protein
MPHRHDSDGDGGGEQHGGMWPGGGEVPHGALDASLRPARPGPARVSSTHVRAR